MKNTFFFSRILSALLILLTVSLAACKKDGSAKRAGEASSKEEIQWYADGIESALAAAKKENRPLFVYWGAVWCPPCNVVKATVFTDKEFIEATRKFISVYLDGDTESAQEWGEKLNASGYPTLMVLGSDGKEIVRLSPEVPPKEFAEALNSVYDNLHPIDQLIEKVLTTPVDQVDAKTWQIVAGYSWSQAEGNEAKIDWVDSFAKLEQRIPAKFAVEKDRLFVNYALARVNGLKKDETLTDGERKAISERMQKILADPEKFAPHLQTFSYYSANLVKALFAQKSDERDAFIAAYKSALEAARAKLSAGSNDHLVSFYPLVELGKMEGETITGAEKNLIKKEMLEAVNKISDAHQQVFISSTASYILEQADLADVARQVLEQDIKKSKTPYYAMASLASLEKKAGNNAKALEWIERAYNTSQGNATRIQWGSSYLIYMMDLSADQKDKILREVQKFYRDHIERPDAFMGRNKARLDRIAAKLKEWSEKSGSQAQIKTLKKQLLDGCQDKSSSKTDFYREGCKKYFEGLI